MNGIAVEYLKLIRNSKRLAIKNNKSFLLWQKKIDSVIKTFELIDLNPNWNHSMSINKKAQIRENLKWYMKVFSQNQ